MAYLIKKYQDENIFIKYLNSDILDDPSHPVT
jgi:hypothetical protein